MASKKTLKVRARRKRQKEMKMNYCTEANACITQKAYQADGPRAKCNAVPSEDMAGVWYIDDYIVAYTKPQQEKKECVMNSTTKTFEQEARDRFAAQTDCHFWGADYPLRRKFGLIDDPSPKNGKELRARLAEGKYVVKDRHDDEEEFFYENPMYFIEWRDPTVKKDQEGFDAAYSALEAKRDKTKNKIYAAATPADMLALLEQFQSETVN